MTSGRKERFKYVYIVYIVYMRDGQSTVRVNKSTKTRLIDLDFAKKNMSYDDIINGLLDRYKKGGKK